MGVISLFMITPINFKAIKGSGGLISPSVITSKPAERDLLNIQTEHGNLVDGLAAQALKVNNYRQQKAAEIQNENAIRSEMEKERMVANTADKKNDMDFQLKNAELDIKRSALSMK